MTGINRILIILLTILYCIVDSSCIKALELEVSDRAKHDQQAKGELIIEIKKGVIELGKEKGIVPKEKVSVKSELMESFNRKCGLISIEKLFSGTRKDTPSDIYVFRFPTDINIQEIISIYKKDTNVIYAEPNYIMRALKNNKGKER